MGHVSTPKLSSIEATHDRLLGDRACLSIDFKHLVQIDRLRQKALTVGYVEGVGHKLSDLKESDPPIEESGDSNLIGSI